MRTIAYMYFFAGLCNAASALLQFIAFQYDGMNSHMLCSVTGLLIFMMCMLIGHDRLLQARKQEKR